MGIGAEINTLKSVPKKAFLHVSRMVPGTKAEDLAAFLKPKAPEVECEVLQSKYPDKYTSFKVTVDLHSLEKLKNAEDWPDGTRVSRFFHKRPPREKLNPENRPPDN